MEPAKHGGDEANKGEKAKTETWSDVVKGLKTKDELETANSDESGNRSEAADSVRMFGFVENRTQLPLLLVDFTLAHGHTRLVM